MDARPLPENWLRTDALTTVCLMVLSCVMAWLPVVAGTSIFKTSVWLQFLGCVLMTLPLIWRRRFPLTSGIAVCGIYLVLIHSTGLDLYASQVSLCLAFFSIGAWSAHRAKALVARIAISIAMALGVALDTLDLLLRLQAGQPDGVTLEAVLATLSVTWLHNVLFFATAWVFGDRGWQQAMEQLELERANTSVRELQADLVSKAIEEERLRIARELHDVVAHHVTTMSVQAAAARRLLDTDRERARASLKEVEAGARLAVRDLRSVVLMLRSGEANYESLPTLKELGKLVTSSQQTGLKVNYDRIGELPPLTPAIELTLYRVAQEALTNAAKHAGPSARVEVRLRGRSKTVELEVADDGIGMRTGLPGTGTGLIGMRERVTAVGGTLETGSKPRGGFRVRAEVPAEVSA